MTESAKKITTIARRHEFFVLRQRLRFQLFCQHCAAEEQFVSIDDAVLFSGLATREIVRLVETRGLHYLESSGGHLFICQKSLSANELLKSAETNVFQINQTNTNLPGEKR